MYGLEIQSMYDYFSYVAAENLKEMWSQPVEILRCPSGAEFSDFFFSNSLELKMQMGVINLNNFLFIC